MYMPVLCVIFKICTNNLNILITKIINNNFYSLNFYKTELFHNIW